MLFQALSQTCRVVHPNTAGDVCFRFHLEAEPQSFQPLVPKSPSPELHRASCPPTRHFLEQGSKTRVGY